MITPAADFIRSAGIAAMSFPDFPGLTFSFGGQPIQFGVLEEIGPSDVRVELSSRDLRDSGSSAVIGLICFLADVRGVNLILELANVEEGSLLHIRTTLSLNGFIPCREPGDELMDLWVRLAQSLAA